MLLDHVLPPNSSRVWRLELMSTHHQHLRRKRTSADAILVIEESSGLREHEVDRKLQLGTEPYRNEVRRRHEA